MKTYASLTQDDRLEIIRAFNGEAHLAYDPLQAAAIVARRIFGSSANGFAIVLTVVAFAGVVDVKFKRPRLNIVPDAPGPGVKRLTISVEGGAA